MKKQYTCFLCHKTFYSKSNLQRHQSTIHEQNTTQITCPLCNTVCENIVSLLTHQSNVHKTTITPEKKKGFDCPNCKKNFTRKHDLMRHQTTACKCVKSDDEKEDTCADKVEEIKSETLIDEDKIESIIENRLGKIYEKIEKLEKKPTNILQIVCVSNTDNYLDMLTNRIASMDQAIEYVKDCALSDVSGDCKLIEKIYNQKENPSFYTDSKQSKIIYHNEKNERIVESRDSFSRKISNNLQNSYLKCINQVINNVLLAKDNPNKCLDQYDMQTWNKHIYDLLDAAHQKKLMKQLFIPVENN